MRHESRAIRFSHHAQKRLAQRSIDRADAEQIVRSGAIRPDADCDFVAYGSFGGKYIEVACLDKGDHLFVKTVY